MILKLTGDGGLGIEAEIPWSSLEDSRKKSEKGADLLLE
jgi:hypothetical protein